MFMKITIITPTKNSEKYIEGNLRSVHLLQDKDLDIEQIIVDGQSNDKTVDIVKSFINKHNAKIKILVRKDKSMYEAINSALCDGVGNIWACLNSDDRYFPFVLRKIFWEFVNNPAIDVIYAPFVLVNEKGKKNQVNFLPFNLKHLICSQACTNISYPSTFFRKRVIDQIGFFNTKYIYASDYDYLIRVGILCKLKYVKFPTTLFLDHSSSLTRKYSIMMATEGKIISEYYIKKMHISPRNTIYRREIERIYKQKLKYFLYFPKNMKNYIIKKIVKK